MARLRRNKWVQLRQQRECPHQVARHECQDQRAPPDTAHTRQRASWFVGVGRNVRVVLALRGEDVREHRKHCDDDRTDKDAPAITALAVKAAEESHSAYPFAMFGVVAFRSAL